MYSNKVKVVLDSDYMFKATLLNVPLFDGDSTAAKQQILVHSK